MESNQDIIEKLTAFGIKDFSHTQGGLLKHLQGTEAILRRWNCSEALCRAGLCHSIYGTESYKAVAVSRDNRSAIEAMLGTSSERLVYLFCAHEKESLWENLDMSSDYSIRDRFLDREIALSADEFSDIVTLTLANWLEQRPRVEKKWHFIRQKEFLRSKPLLPPVAFEEFCDDYQIK